MQYGERVRPNAIIAILMHGMTNRLKTMFGLSILCTNVWHGEAYQKKRGVTVPLLFLFAC